MTRFQSSNSILIISNDSFIKGLLTGYCIANHFALECITRSKPLNANRVSSGFKVIIIDLRELTLPLIDAHLTSLQTIKNQYAIPIGAIYNHNEQPLSIIPPWVDSFEDENFIEKLDSYIDKYIINFTHIFDERRNCERRSGSERRTLSGGGNNFSAKQLNGNTGLIDKKEISDLSGVFKIDKDYKTVYLKGKDLELTSKEFKLFNLLAEAPEKVCTTEKIIKHLWPNRSRANKSDLYQYMHLLRKKIEVDPEKPCWILTIKGIGYKLNV